MGNALVRGVIGLVMILSFACFADDQDSGKGNDDMIYNSDMWSEQQTTTDDQKQFETDLSRDPDGGRESN